MFFLQADLAEGGQIAIGFFDTIIGCIDAAEDWFKKEIDGGSEDYICLFAWYGFGTDIVRSDLSDNLICKELTKAFRKIEKI